MIEVLRTGAAVATPLGLLGLVAALGYYFYSRHLRHEEKRLESLPREERARLTDGRLTRYGVDASRLTRDDKHRLILDEMDKRYRFARLCTVVFSAVFVVCFGIASAAYLYATRAKDQNARDLEELKKRVETLTAEGAIVKARLNELTKHNPTQALQDPQLVSGLRVVVSDDEVQRILLDPSSSDRDRVDALILSTIKSVDAEVNYYTERLRAIPQSPEFDVEAMKLKRAIDKRTQTFELLRQIIDRYNATAKGIIDSIGR
jgi:hypothetical protein